MQIILAGFGGQGILSMGQLLAYGGILEGREVAYLPAYGAEMRGGTANCMVTVSSSPISSPLVNEPDILVVMNRPSLDKFETWLKPGGALFINSSLVDRSVKRKDVKIYYVPVNELAAMVGDSRVANMIMLGALLQAVPFMQPLSILESLKKTLHENKHHLLPLNARALQIGETFMKQGKQEKNDCKVS